MYNARSDLSDIFFHHLGGCLPFAEEEPVEQWQNKRWMERSEMENVEMEGSEMESVEMERNVTRWTLDSADQS